MSIDAVSVKRDERRWQDDQGGSLQQQAYERPGTQIVMQKQFMCVAEALDLKPGIRLLDLGCGAGLFLGWLAQYRQAEYYGIDLSLNSAQSARQLSSRLNIDLHSALCEVYRILAPGGILVMYEPTATPLTNVVRKLFFGFDKYESPADLAHKEEFTRRSVHSTLLRTGFTNIVASQHDFLAYPISGMYINLPLSRSRVAMKLLTRIEQVLGGLSVLRPVLEIFSWRLLVVAVKPPE